MTRPRCRRRCVKRAGRGPGAAGVAQREDSATDCAQSRLGPSCRCDQREDDAAGSMQNRVCPSRWQARREDWAAGSRQSRVCPSRRGPQRVEAATGARQSRLCPSRCDAEHGAAVSEQRRLWQARREDWAAGSRQGRVCPSRRGPQRVEPQPVLSRAGSAHPAAALSASKAQPSLSGGGSGRQGKRTGQLALGESGLPIPLAGAARGWCNRL